MSLSAQACFLLLMTLVRPRLWVAIEQPTSSWLIKLPCLRQVARVWGLVRTLTCQGPFGHKLLKPTHIFSNEPTPACQRSFHVLCCPALLTVCSFRMFPHVSASLCHSPRTMSLLARAPTAAAKQYHKVKQDRARETAAKHGRVYKEVTGRHLLRLGYE